MFRMIKIERESEILITPKDNLLVVYLDYSGYPSDSTCMLDSALCMLIDQNLKKEMINLLRHMADLEKWVKIQ